LEQVGVDSAGENYAVDQTVFLEDWRKIDFIGGGARGIVQDCEEYVMFQATGVGFDPLQNASVKGMDKIAIAQKKTHNFGAALEHAARLGIGAEGQATNRFQNARASFMADLRTRIEHARNRADTNAGGARNIANGGLLWNRFHDNRSLLP
jgi:hypothetical protein